MASEEDFFYKWVQTQRKGILSSSLEIYEIGGDEEMPIVEFTAEEAFTLMSFIVSYTGPPAGFGVE